MIGWVRKGVLLAAFVALPALGCIEDNPYHVPQGSTSAGPRGSAAFISGEASRTGLTPVKEGGLDAGLEEEADAGGGGGATDTSVVVAPDTVQGFLDLLIPVGDLQL